MEDKNQARNSTVSAFSRSIGMFKRPGSKANSLSDQLVISAQSAFVTSKQILRTLTQVLSIIGKTLLPSSLVGDNLTPVESEKKSKKKRKSNSWWKNALGLLAISGFAINSLMDPEVRENLGKYFTNFLEGIGLGKQFREEMIAKLESFKEKVSFLKNVLYVGLGVAALAKVFNVISLLYSLGKAVYLGLKLSQLADIVEEYTDAPAGEGPRTAPQRSRRAPTTVIRPRPVEVLPKPPALPGPATPTSPLQRNTLSESVKNVKSGKSTVTDATEKSSISNKAPAGSVNKPVVKPSVIGMRAIGGAGAALGLYAGASTLENAVNRWQSGDKPGAVIDALSGLGSIIAGIGAVLLLLGVAVPAAGAALTVGSVTAIAAGIISLIRSQEGYSEVYDEDLQESSSIDYWNNQEKPMQFNTVPPSPPSVVNDSKDVSLNTTVGNNTTVLAMTQPIIYVG